MLVQSSADTVSTNRNIYAICNVTFNLRWFLINFSLFLKCNSVCYSKVAASGTSRELLESYSCILDKEFGSPFWYDSKLFYSHLFYSLPFQDAAKCLLSDRETELKVSIALIAYWSEMAEMVRLKKLQLQIDEWSLLPLSGVEFIII